MDWGTKVAPSLRVPRELFFSCTEDSLRSHDWQLEPEALGSLRPGRRFYRERRANRLGCAVSTGIGAQRNSYAVAMERGGGDRTASALFAGFRALGLFSNDIPHVVRFSALKRRFFVTTCVGKSLHTYDVSDFFLRRLPGNHPPRLPALSGGDAALLPNLHFAALSPPRADSALVVCLGRVPEAVWLGGSTRELFSSVGIYLLSKYLLNILWKRKCEWEKFLVLATISN